MAKKVSRSRKPASPARRRTSRVMEEPQAMTPAPAAPAATAPAMNNLLVLILIVLAFFAGYFYFKAQNLEKKGTTAAAGTQPQQQAQAPLNLKPKKPSTDEHWRGPKDARIVMIEYSDLECPFCKRIHPDLQKLQSENGSNVAWVFRHFPLSFHPKAEKSAEATECVNELAGNDGFWKMADTIYEKMPALELTDLPATAASAAGVDEAAVKQCIDSGKYASRVKSDQDEGTQIGVQATPTTVFYNMKTGKAQTVEGAVPYTQLKQVLDSMLKG